MSTRKGIFDDPAIGEKPLATETHAHKGIFDDSAIGKGDAPGHAFHGNQWKEGEKAALETVRSSMLSHAMGRYADAEQMGNRNIVELPGEQGHELSVRDFGDWKNPPDAAGEEDYDYQVPTKETTATVHNIVAAAGKQHPNIKFDISGSEKNYTMIRATHTGRSKK